MGRLKKALQNVVEHPRAIGLVAGLASVPYAIKTLSRLSEELTPYPTIGDMLACTLKIWSPFIAYSATRATTMLIRDYIREDPNRPRTKKGDGKKLRTLEEKLNAQTPPKIQFVGTTEISFHPIIFLKHYFSKDPKKVERIARKQHNPALAIEAAMRHFFKNQFDEGLICMRDATDWLTNKKPKLSLTARINLLFPRIACSIAKKTSPRHAEVYLLSAAVASILNPEKAWYWSALGKLAADEFGLNLKKEIYVFHALLATAQKRSDVEDAWRDALLAIREQPYWERIGETRTLVRILKNNKFFAQTLIFKEREQQEQLLREANAYKTLEELAQEVTVPQVLYVTSEKQEGKYALVMRHLKGETLYEKLAKGDKTAVSQVINALAKIHARMPTNLPRLPVAWKLRSKLLAQEFNITRELAKKVVQNYRPVYDAILQDAFWVWNKDAHPENWIIGDKIGVIDCEADYLVPVTFDLVNLLEYGNFFIQEEKKLCITMYAHELSKEKTNLNNSTLMRAYYNSAIHRMLSLASAWSSPERKRMHSKRKEAITKATNFIEEISKEDKEYYERHKENYDKLKEALTEICQLMVSYTP
ncbi:MAG: aminoglycoside phosphotransferase family protein [Candidatus Woesearchaeota archaeon]